MRGRWLGIAAAAPGLPGRLRAARPPARCPAAAALPGPGPIVPVCGVLGPAAGPRWPLSAAGLPGPPHWSRQHRENLHPGGVDQLRALITPALRQIPANGANHRNAGVICERNRNAGVISRLTQGWSRGAKAGHFRVSGMVPVHPSAAGLPGPASPVTSAPRNRPRHDQPRVLIICGHQEVPTHAQTQIALTGGCARPSPVCISARQGHRVAGLPGRSVPGRTAGPAQ